MQVDDNYCFVVDGDKIRMGDIMGDDQWWRHTSRPTKLVYPRTFISNGLCLWSIKLRSLASSNYDEL